MRKVITGFLASTIILSQLSGGLKVLAEGEQEVLPIGEGDEETLNDHIIEDSGSDETIYEQSELNEEAVYSDTILEVEEIADEIGSNETTNESEEEQWEPVKEDEIVEYQDYDKDNDNAYTDDDYFYFELLDQIKVIDVEFSSTEIQRNNNILIYVTLDTEAEISYIELNLISNSGKEHWLDLSYNDEFNRFEGIFNFSQSDFKINSDRDISVHSIGIHDTFGYSKFLYTNDNEINAPTLVNSIPVHESVPVIKTDSFSASSNEIFGNEQIQLELRIDSDVPMERVEVYYMYNDYNQYTVSLEQFGDTNRYIGFFRKPYAYESTVFEVSSIFAEDSYGNKASISSTIDGIDLSNLSIAYTHKSSVLADDAEYIEDSLTVSREEANIGDIIEYSIKVDDPGDIYSITLSLSRVNDSGSRVVNLFYDNESNSFIGEWKISRSDLSGEWIPEYIEHWSSQSWFYHQFVTDIVMDSHMVNVTAYSTEIEQPDIKLNNIRAEKNEAPINSSNTIFMDIESAVSIDYFLLTLYGTHVDHPVTYNHETGEFQAVIHLHETYTDTIEFSQLTAVIGNDYYIIDTKDVDLSNVSIKLLDAEDTSDDEDGSEEYIAPVMDTDSLTILDSIVKAGEPVTITVPISEYHKVSNASIMYVTPLSNGYVSVDFIYNTDTELFEAVIETNETLESGLWRVESISMWDTDYNYSGIDPWDGDSYDILKKLSFILEGGVKSGYRPSLELAAIDIEGSNYTSGETVSISVETTESTYEFITLYYRLPVSGILMPVNLMYNQNSGNYEGQVAISENSESGRWLIEKVGADGNEDSFISDIRLLADGGFRVSNASTTIQMPTFNQESYTASFDEKTGSLRIETEATDSNLVRTMYATYADLNNDEIYVIQLEKNGNSSTYVGQIDLPHEVDINSLMMTSIDIIGYEGYVIRRVVSDFVNPFGGVDTAFASVSLIVNEEDEVVEDGEDVEDSEVIDETDDSEEPNDTSEPVDSDNGIPAEEETDESVETDTDTPIDEGVEDIDELENSEEESDSSVETDNEEGTIEDETPENDGNFDTIITDENNSENNNETTLPSIENNEDTSVEEETTDESAAEEGTTEILNGAENQSTDKGSVDASVDTPLPANTDAEKVASSGMTLPSTATATWSIGLMGLLSAAAGTVLKVSKKKQ